MFYILYTLYMIIIVRCPLSNICIELVDTGRKWDAAWSRLTNLRLERQKCLEQHVRFPDLRRDVCVGVLAEGGRVVHVGQEGDVVLVVLIGTWAIRPCFIERDYVSLPLQGQEIFQMFLIL